MADPSPYRVAAFIEFDMELGNIMPTDNPDEVTVDIHTAGGRIVLEDGTIIMTFTASERSGRG